MLIFLDIDGVMVPAKGWKTPELLEDGFPMFSQKATQALTSLLSGNPRVILSTSHRDRFTVEGWKKIFETRGLRINKLEQISSAHTFRKRKDEIEEWLEIHGTPSKFIILDDDKSLHALPLAVKEHWVETSPYIGLTPELLEESHIV